MHLAFLFPDKFLRPVMPVRAASVITDAQFGIRRIKYICTMSGTVKPRRHYFLRRSLSGGDVFTGGTVRNAEMLKHLKRRAVSRALVTKIVIDSHIL